MVDHMWELHRFAMEELRCVLRPGDRILDLGSGKGIWAFLVRAEIDGANSMTIVGADIDQDTVGFVRPFHLYQEIILADIQSLPFKARSFDVVLALEVLEHVTKESGWKVLDEIQRVCRRTVVLSTPNGFAPTPNSCRYHVHHSGWSVGELRSQGYSVRGYAGRGTYSMMAKFPIFALVWAYLLTPFAYVFPRISGALVAVKEIHSEKEEGRTGA